MYNKLLLLYRYVVTSLITCNSIENDDDDDGNDDDGDDDDDDGDDDDEGDSEAIMEVFLLQGILWLCLTKMTLMKLNKKGMRCRSCLQFSCGLLLLLLFFFN